MAAAAAPRGQSHKLPFSAPANIACPDPAAHNKDRRLQEQASTAALYVTHPRPNDHLGPDGKLSSASAATSLKYARAQDLPSYPVVGLDASNSAGSAALLAAGNKTKIEWWKPQGTSDNAAKAALLANDYKMPPSWQPQLSTAGSKAALLAHKDGAKVDCWSPEPSAAGNSAAGIAMRNKPRSPIMDNTGKNNALTAATGAVAAGSRRRADSSPMPLRNSTQTSLNAANLAHKPSVRRSGDASRPNSEALESARITHLGANVPKEMFGAAPPVSIEVDEQRRQDALRASALSMAKQMYQAQQSAINEAAAISNAGETAARGASAKAPSTTSTITSPADLKAQAMQYVKVQEHAQKLAAERLAKLEPDGPAAFRNYYGYSNTPQRSRLSVRRGRRRASSEGAMVDSDDEEQSRRIRDQMSVFNTKLAQVDARKRQKDRENLFAAAERKVHAQMHTMDEKVFMETGKVPPTIMEEWEAKARAKAAEQSEKRLENHGKVHVGGGRFVDQSEIDAIAASRVAPTLNEISEAAEAQRARDEEQRLDEEEKKRLGVLEKEREAERKTEEKRIKSELKAEEKSRKAQEKAAAKSEKDMEKARRDEEKRLKDDAQRKLKLEEQEEHEKSSNAPMTVLEPRSETSSTRRRVERPVPLTSRSYQPEAKVMGHADSSDDGYNREQQINDDEANKTRRVATAPETTAKPTNRTAKEISFSAPTSPTDHSTSSKENSGSHSLKRFFSRLKRRSRIGGSKERNDANESSSHSNRSSFIGGAALRSQSSLVVTREQPQQPHHRPSTSYPGVISRTTPMATGAVRRSPSVSSLESGDAAHANSSRGGFASSWGTSTTRGRQRSAATGVSSLSNGEDDADDEFVDAPEMDSLAPPPKVGSALAKRSMESPQRDSRFKERF